MLPLGALIQPYSSALPRPDAPEGRTATARSPCLRHTASSNRNGFRWVKAFFRLILVMIIRQLFMEGVSLVFEHHLTQRKYVNQYGVTIGGSNEAEKHLTRQKYVNQCGVMTGGSCQARRQKRRSEWLGSLVVSVLNRETKLVLSGRSG